MRMWGFAIILVFVAGCACEETVVAPARTAADEPAVRDANVVGTIDFRLSASGDSVALAELNRRAIEMGADTVIGAQIVRDGEEVHVTGVAVRSNGDAVLLVDPPAPQPGAMVPMYDDSTGPVATAPQKFPTAAECPQCYEATRFTTKDTPPFWERSSRGFHGFHFRRFR